MIRVRNDWISSVKDHLQQRSFPSRPRLHKDGGESLTTWQTMHNPNHAFDYRAGPSALFKTQ